MFFSGFSLLDEKDIFKEYIINNEFTISGFSYGAIKAFKYVLEAIENSKRIDKLQLFSPAYFNDKSTKFKRLQLLYFQKNNQQYIDNFIQNTIYPNNININKYIKNGTYTQLDELLNFIWDKDDLETITKHNIKIEVYLGEKDKIVDTKEAKDFFQQFAEVYYIKDVGHSLN